MSKKVLITIIVSILVIASIVFGVFYFINKDTKKTDEDTESTVPEKVSIRGEVTDINIISENRGTITVEGKLEEDTLYDQAVITITKDSTITKTADSKTLKIGDMKIGNLVEVTFEGAVKESYPVQADAKWIMIIK